MPPATPSPAWTPYGLEAHRVALLERRGRLLKAAIILGMLAFLALVLNQVREDPLINAIDGNGNQVEIELPNERARAKPTTLSVSPGRTTVLDKAIQPEGRADTGPPPPRERERPSINWGGVLTVFGPPIGAAVYAWRVGKQRVVGPLGQVNFGVYKGAMPLELITAQHKRFVYTPKQAHAHLFGKGREDLLPAKPLVVMRPLGARPGPAAGATRFDRVR